MRAALLVLLCSSVASALKPGAAALSVLLCGSVASALKPGAAFLDAARLRTNSAAREAFAAEVALPKPDSLRLLVAIAAEEHPEIPVIACTERVRCALDDLTARATTRARLESLVGGTEADAAAVARAVAAAMYGDNDQSPGDDEHAFFSGNAADYYDPRNSFLDEVLARKTGIPITMSLVFAEACAGAGAKMHLLNSPGHVLVCPDAPDETFLVDAFNGGAILDNARGQVAGTAPLVGLSLAARLLRNLRLIYERSESYDPVRLLGAAERMLLVADEDVDVVAVPLEERAFCRVTVGVCILALRDESRRDESFCLISDAARNYGQQGKVLDTLLADEWFKGGG